VAAGATLWWNRIQNLQPCADRARGDLYLVIAKLPERDGEFEYRIKHINGPHEFTARESELRWVQG
jgi:hypothetical protein